MSWSYAALALTAFSFAAAAAPRIENVVVKPNPAVFSGGKPPEVEIVVAVSRARVGRQNCDASIDPGDGSRARQLDFGVATTRSVRHVYSKNGSYRVVVKGAGKTPCEGGSEVPLTVSGVPDPAKKAPAKKEAKKKKALKKEKAPAGALPSR
jgi:hypothetical protein